MKTLTDQVGRIFADLDEQAITDLPNKCKAWQEEAKFYLANNEDDFTHEYAHRTWGRYCYTALENYIADETETLLKKHEVRNKKIAAKLMKNNINTINVETYYIIWGCDFETKFTVDNCIVTLKVIFAGGHNIQKAHYRTLCNVKKIK